MARRQGGSGTAGLLGHAGVDLTGSSASSVSSLRTGSSEPSARGSRGPLDVHGVPAPSENASRKGAAKVRNDHLSGHPAGPKPNARSAATSLGTSPGATPSATRARPTEPRAHAGQNFGLDGQPRGRQDEPFHFENFIVGPCNALAREATLALARRRQQSLSLLYLGGLSGMGKTHLAKAAANEARHQLPQAAMHARVAANARTAPRARVIYTTAEQFTSEFVSAMRNGRNDAWAKRYRGPIELLVVEDIQFLTGRDKTQLELFHTIGHVIDGGGSVLVTGDRTPRDLTGLDERLRTQVGSGFVAELDRPDAIVRRHILRAKAASGGVHLPSDCLDMLVHATDANGASVTEVESLLIQVVTTSSLLGRPVDAALVREAVDLKNGAAAELAPRQIDVTEIVKVVATFFGARPEALASRSRRRDVLVPRQLSMYLAHRYTDASLTEIGRCLGRDHPSVRNAIQRIERQVLENAPVRYQVEALSERIDGLL
jgi:chromosomal replication initiator protein